MYTGERRTADSRISQRAGATLLLFVAGFVAGGCGGGGGSGGGAPIDSSAGSLIPAALAVLESTPAADAVQVAVGQSVTVRTDGRLAAGCLTAPGNTVRALSGPAAGDEIQGLWGLTEDGLGLTFTPTSAWDVATDYRVTLGASVCAVDGRLLEAPWQLSFTTIDVTPPTMAMSSLTDGAVDVARQNAAFTFEFDEPVLVADIDGVMLRDAADRSLAVTTQVDGTTLTVRPVADFAGAQSYSLRLDDGVTDRVGNALTAPVERTFTSAADSDEPRYLSSWPSGGTNISPSVVPSVTFSESIDPTSIAADSFSIADLLGGTIGFTTETSPDQRTVYLVPERDLVAGRLYLVTARAGADAVADLSGNRLDTARSFSFTVGTDDAPPVLTTIFPAQGTAGVGTTGLVIEVGFDEDVDIATVTGTDNIRLVETATEQFVPISVALIGGDTVRVDPMDPLTPDTEYRLEVEGLGRTGVRDVAGNPLGVDRFSTFSTSADGTGLSVLIQPFHGAVGVPRGARISATFTEAIDPTSVDATSFEVVRSTTQQPIAGTLEVLRGGRVVRFSPTFSWLSVTDYTVRIIGGASGIRAADGKPLSRDALATFTTGSTFDSRAPTVTATLNDIDDARSENLTVPPYGFSIDLRGVDSLDFSLDSSSFSVELTGPAGTTAPTGAQLFAEATVTGSRAILRMPDGIRLAAGTWMLSATVSDLSGNADVSEPLVFRVGDLTADALPFERTQTVWVRYDLDRNGDGRIDFEQDLERLGLIAAGDPAGTNARMIRLLAEGIVQQAHHLFRRGADGSRAADGSSVPLWLTPDQPAGAVHMMIACGGLDPEGSQTRVYGDDSTGTLGRAYFDFRNARPTESSIATSPGLGVFPGELFLFEAQIHDQVFPAFVTTFANRFLPICPQMGGTAAGAGAFDATVLAEDFVRSESSASERARYDTIMRAADAWSVAIGTILAHEVGHAVGLVANGPNPFGLHGDASLHNSFAQSTDVMASAVGFDALISLDYGFRDLTDAYLRHRILMK